MNVNATLEYRPEPYDGKISLLLGSDKFVTVKHNPLREWQRVCANVDVQRVPGHHFTILKQPNVGILAETLNRLLGVTTDSTDDRPG